MQRIVVSRSATLSRDFSFTPTGTPTVVVTRSDGTTATTGAVQPTADPTVFEYTIPATELPQLDELTEVWTAVTGGVNQTFRDTIEVAGGVLFSIAEARGVTPLNDTVKYPDARIIEVRTLVEEALEDACGVAFVPRFKRERVSGHGHGELALTQPRVIAIRSVKLDGVAVTDAATVIPSSAGVVYYPAYWTGGFGNYEVAYEHGYTTPPARVRHAALRLAKRWLIEGPVDDRATSMSTEDGTFSLVTPGVRGALFDIPEVNAVVQQYGVQALVA